MASAKYWGTKEINNVNVNPTSKKKGKKLIKGLGIGGGIVVVLVGILALLLFIFVVKPATALAVNLNDLKADAEKLEAAFTERDLVKFEEALNETEVDLNEMRVARDKNFGWGKDLPIAEDYYRDSDHFIDAGLYAVAAGREFMVVVEPFGDAVGLKTTEEQEVEELGLAEAFSTWISVMPQVANDLDGVIAQLTLVGEELSYVDPSRYPESVNGVNVRETIESSQNILTQLNTYAPDIKTALTIIPGLLGVETGEKRYMIVMQNDKELRATGGFWTYISTFKIKDALLSSDFTSYNSYYVDDVLNTIDAYHTFPKVPPAYERHLKVERMFARDANISPDLPTSVDQLMEFWELAMPLAPGQLKPVDGVVVIDTQVLEELMEITGPVTLNGVTYTSENIVLELEKIASLALAEQVNRKQILGDMMEEMLVNVFESESNLWPVLVEKGIDLAARKHVSGVVFDEEAQRILEEYNLSGRIVDPVEGDYAFVVQTNLGGDKTNWFVDKEVTHSLEQEGDRYVRTVNIKYVYTEPGPEFAPFVKRFRDWVRVYVPQGSELISVDGSEDVTGEGEERNKTYFHGWVTAGPGETKEITFKYYLPEGVVTGTDYNLYLQKQAGIDVEIHNVVVNGQSEAVELKYDKKYSTEI